MLNGPPLERVWKVNIDGSAFGKPSPTGIGGVICSWKGKVLLMFPKNVGVKDSNLVELLEVVETLTIVANANIDLLLTSLLKVTPTSSQLGSKKMKNITFVHILKEADHFANSLAKMGVHTSCYFVAWL
ncbi:uncharacterized protein LOC111298243 [Durio zibethinus]|uniref:Uncharacterized protein LOC111298243 n=1 Tax=Durio zibethinus TaxID=66656 RepID=A0A6P5Z8D2_DURZI|nr:uncharacterized protein LOC111298243 [Durio zibethinus]